MLCHGAGQSNAWRTQPTLWLVNFATFNLLDEANKFVPCLKNACCVQLDVKTWVNVDLTFFIILFVCNYTPNVTTFSNLTP
jgi:hypothetical protein